MVEDYQLILSLYPQSLCKNISILSLYQGHVKGKKVLKKGLKFLTRLRLGLGHFNEPRFQHNFHAYVSVGSRLTMNHINYRTAIIFLKIALILGIA